MERQKKTVAIPNSWNGITIQMFQKFEELKKKNLKEDEFNKQVLSVICDIDGEMVDKMEVKSIKKIFKLINKYILYIVLKTPASLHFFLV